MLFERNGTRPTVDPAALLAPSASIVGDVTIGAGSYIDHNVVIESSGAPVTLEDEVVVFAGSVLRSVGGASRPGFELTIGAHSLVAPQCTLTGCQIGRDCYLATGVIVLQGASVGDGSRLGIGAIVHVGTALPTLARVGLRHVAVPTSDGYLSTANVEQSRELVAAADFFDRTFDSTEADQQALHREVISRLLAEVHNWHDAPVS